MITFTVPAVPVAQPRARAAVRGKHAMVYGAPKSHPVHAFKASVRMAFQEQQAAPIDGPVRLGATYVMPRPGKLRWKKRPMPRAWHTTKPDADNLIKAVKDALNGLAWHDDSQVAECHTVKVYAAGDEQPHVRITIERIDHEPKRFIQWANIAEHAAQPS